MKFIGKPIHYELIIKDLDSVEGRIDKIKKQAITGDKEKKIEYEILVKCKAHLENGLSLRNLELETNEVKWIKHLSLITLKPLIYVANIDETAIKTDNEHITALKSIINDENLILISSQRMHIGRAAGFSSLSQCSLQSVL